MKVDGTIFAELRREAGYTQKTLAEALNITDKAISKWERGLSLPDISLFPKLSVLLDTDIELLLQDDLSGLYKDWVGLIDLREFETDMACTVYDKPMVYYILSHFLLMDIREIYVLGSLEGQSWLSWEVLDRIGFRFHCNPEELPKQNYMIMQHPCFLFGSDLTRRFQVVMANGKLAKLCPKWDATPFLFCPAEYSFLYYKNPSYLQKKAAVKTLGRGMVCLPLDTPEDVYNVASFVRIYQNSSGLVLQDVEGIAARGNHTAKGE